MPFAVSFKMGTRHGFFRTALEATLHPVEFFGNEDYFSEGIGNALMFQLKGWGLMAVAALVSMLFGGVFLGIASDVWTQWGILGLIVLVVLVSAFIIVNLFAVSAIVHFLLVASGMRIKNKLRFSTTFSVISYSMSPVLAFIGPFYILVNGILRNFSSQMWASLLLAFIAILFQMTLLWFNVVAFVGLSGRHKGVSLFRSFIAMIVGILMVTVFWNIVTNLLAYYVMTLPEMKILESAINSATATNQTAG